MDIIFRGEEGRTNCNSEISRSPRGSNLENVNAMEGRKMNLDYLNVLSLRYLVEYPGAKGVEDYIGNVSLLLMKKIRLRGTYLGVINKEIGKGIVDGKLFWGQNIRKFRE